jgi:hypothetical protein
VSLIGINILTKSCNLYMLSENKNGKALLQCCCVFKLIDMITLLCIERCPGTPFKCLSECCYKGKQYDFSSAECWLSNFGTGIASMLALLILLPTNINMLSLLPLE